MYKVDNVSAEDYSGNDKLNRIGFLYENKKVQYDKALAWYLLAARENHSTAQNNIGVLYYNGDGVPKNHFYALKWQLKSARQNEYKYP
jgi:TPR repeat protein